MADGVLVPPAWVNGMLPRRRPASRRLCGVRAALAPPTSTPSSSCRHTPTAAAEEERLQPRHFDDPALKERYLEHGFVIIASVVGPEELARLRAEAVALSERAPAARGSPLDRHGRPCPEPSAYQFTDASKSDDPLTWQSSEQAPSLARINQVMSFSAVTVAAHGNARLLSVVKSIYGDDFVPAYYGSWVYKQPAHGVGFHFHQDGAGRDEAQAGQHRRPPGFSWGRDEERGLNVGVYLQDSTVENGCVHVMPRSHREGRLSEAALEQRQRSLAVPVRGASPRLSTHNTPNDV